MRRFLSVLILSLTTVALAGPSGARADVPVDDPDDPVLAALEAELARAWADLSQKGEEAPYFIGLQVIEQERIGVAAEEGALQGYRPSRVRWVHADVRVGDPRLDSTHPLPKSPWIEQKN